MTAINSAGLRAVHTPQGRFVRKRMQGVPTLACGHPPEPDGLGFTRYNGEGNLPESLCFDCMDRFLQDFAAGRR